VPFLAEDFAQAGEEGEAHSLHRRSHAHGIDNDCVNIAVDHVESPFYRSCPGKDWRLQPGLFISEVPAGVAIQQAGFIAMAISLECSATL